jgi:hypothetical protein
MHLPLGFLRRSVHEAMPSSRDASAFIRRSIEAAFKQTPAEYESEVELATALARTTFAALRPVFATGNPEDVEPGRYLLFVGLNPKLDPQNRTHPLHQRRLNGGASTNEEVTMGYFSRYPLPHPYFRHRAKVVSAFLAHEHLPAGHEIATLLKTNALFIESVPYSSANSQNLRSEALRGLRNVQRSHAILHHLLEEYPPAAVILDGNATQGLLETPPSLLRELQYTTQWGACVIGVSRLGRIPVLRTPFIRSRGGPNSNLQLRELGEILAAEVRKATRRCLQA